MRAHQADFPVLAMCRVLKVSPSGYYAWLKRPLSGRTRADAVLKARVEQIHQRSRGTCGAPRIRPELAEEGQAVVRKPIALLMLELGVRGVCGRRRISTTRRSRQGRVASDLVNRVFSASGPNLLWVADITYLPTASGFLYLSVVVDAWSRRVVGWAMASHLRTQLVLDALDMALYRRRPHSVIHHSDHGSIRPWPSGCAAARPGCVRRWDRSVIASTMPCVKAFLPRWKGSCWIVIGLPLMPRPG